MIDQKDEAFAWLERAFKARDAGMVYLKMDPKLDNLQEDPVFTRFSEKMGL